MIKYNQKKVKIIWLLAILASIAIVANVAAFDSTGSASNITPKHVSKARISLETNHLDLAETSDGHLLSNESLPSIAHVPESPVKWARKRKVKERENRRLSNIWSLLLPDTESASSDTDYEENVAPEDKTALSSEIGNQDSTSEVETINHGIATNSSGRGPALERNNHQEEINKDRHDERIVAKFSKPSHQQFNMSTESFMVSSSNVAPVIEHQTSWSNSTSLPMSHRKVNDSVQLITGSLTSGINLDLLGNSMMNLANETEREGGTQPESRHNSTDNTGNNLERWLAKFNSIESTTIPPTSTTLKPSTTKPPFKEASKPSRQELMVKNTTAFNPGHSLNTNSDVVRMLEALADLGVKQPNQFRLHRTRASNNPGKISDFAMEQRKLQQMVHAMNSNGHPSTGKYHPFQQQLIRQHQNQDWMHFGHQPVGQASSISVSTQDGASNTSLSFAMSDQLHNAMGSEVSQVESSTKPPSSSSPNSSISSSNGQHSLGSKEEDGRVEQSVFQSQDEILRQVTSAINFEQQLAQNTRDSSNTSTYNHRKSGEPPSLIPQDGPTEDGRLFRSGSDINSFLQLQAKQPSNGTTNNLVGLEDVDQNIESFAEKLRHLVQQQQQQQNSSASNGTGQPSWLLRKPPLMTTQPQPTNQTSKLANELSGTGNGLEKLNELLSKMEKSKNELRNSQENMAMLMQQLVQQYQQQQKYNVESGQLQKGSSTPMDISKPNPTTSGPTETLVEVEESGPKHQDDLGSRQQHVAGWMPVSKPSYGQVPPLSPSNLLKSRTKQVSSLVKAAQSGQNAGYRGQENIPNDDYVSNQLEMMLGNSGHDQSQINMNQRIIGLPIAIMKEDEIELQPGQQLDEASIEAAAAVAAEQLGALPARSSLMQSNTNRLKTSPMNGDRQSGRIHQSAEPLPERAHLVQVDHLSHVQKLLQNQSPQTFSLSHSVTPRAPFGSEQQGLFQQTQQHQHSINQEQIASLIPSTEERIEQGRFRGNLGLVPSREMEQQGAHPLSSAQTILDTPVDPNSPKNLRKEQTEDVNPQMLPGPNRSLGLDEFRMHKQAQQQALSVTSIPSMMQRSPGHAYVQTTSTVEYPPRAGLVHHYDFGGVPGQNYAQPPFAPHSPLVTTTSVTSGGPPVRVHEISLPRPFGFRGNHAFAYQPSPVVAAMFPRLTGSQSRPSIFRHMSPVRASLSASQRLIRPLMGSNDDHGSINQYGYHGQSVLNSLPFSPMHSPTYMQRVSRGGIQGRHRRPTDRLKSLMEAQSSESWRARKLDTYSSPRNLRAFQAEQEHLDGIELPLRDTELLMDDDETTMNFHDDIKYLPMDSIRQTTIRDTNEVDIQPLDKSIVYGQSEVKRPEQRPNSPEARQQRAFQMKPVATSSKTTIVNTKTTTPSLAPPCNHNKLQVDKPSNWPILGNSSKTSSTSTTKSPSSTSLPLVKIMSTTPSTLTNFTSIAILDVSSASGVERQDAPRAASLATRVPRIQA